MTKWRRRFFSSSPVDGRAASSKFWRILALTQTMTERTHGGGRAGMRGGGRTGDGEMREERNSRKYRNGNRMVTGLLMGYGNRFERLVPEVPLFRKT